MIAKLSAHTARHSYLIFLIDGIGAVVSAMLLATVIAPFHQFFGMPQNIVLSLALPAFFFAVYSLSCYFFKPANYRLFLCAIIIANLLYSIASLGFTVYYWPQLTTWGVVYFIGEVIVIMSLVSFEWLVLKAMSSTRQNAVGNVAGNRS